MGRSWCRCLGAALLFPSGCTGSVQQLWCGSRAVGAVTRASLLESQGPRRDG